MASLANQTISSTYDGLIKTSTDQPVPISGVQLLEDGVGNSLALSVGRANQGVTVTGTLTATSITGVLADGVTATTQTLGDNSTKVATTAYVDAQVTASDLDFAGDTGTGAVDLDSQTFTIAGTANEIETVASGQTITIGLPSSVTVGTLNATNLGGTISTAAQPNITSVGTLSSLAVSGNLTVDTNTLYVDASGNSVGIGSASPSVFSNYSTLSINGTNGGILNLKVSETETARLQAFSGAFNIAAKGASTELTFETNGSERMRIDSSGNLLVGLTSGGKFSVSYGGNDTHFGLGGNYDNYITAGSGGTTIFRNGTTERMRITSAGNVGIGTATAAGANGKGLAIYASDFPRLSFRNSTTGDTTNDGMEMYMAGLNFYHDLGEAGSQIFYTSATERMRIDSSGNVGIGTSNPTHFLHISRLATFASMMVESTASNAYALYQGKTANSSTWQWGVWNDNSYRVGVSGVADYMTITSGGDVGIGTSSPSATLQVKGDDSTGTDNFYLENSSASRILRLRNDGYTQFGTLGASPYNFGVSTSTKAMFMDSGGGFGFNSSIRASKTNINTAPSADWIYDYDIVTFNYKKRAEDGSYLEEADSELRWGVIAEDAEVINSDFCSYDSNGTVDGFHYDRLVPVLVKAIQELKAEIETLKSQING